MLVSEVMTTPVVSVGPDASIKEAVQVLAAHGVTAVPVLDDGDLVGVLSEADLLVETFLPDPRAHERAVEIGAGPLTERVGALMNRCPITVAARADLAEAAALMTGSVVKSLPVVEGDAVVGMLSRRDLIAVLARHDDDIEAGVDALVRAAGYDWDVEVADGVVLVHGPQSEAEVGIARVLASTAAGVVGVRISA